MTDKFPKYFIATTKHFGVKYWILLNKNGDTRYITHNLLSYDTNWNISFWNRWIKEKCIIEVQPEELALMI